MITVTGKIENAAGVTLHATIDFISKSTPLVSAGVITTNTDKTIRSNPTDGTFSVLLAPGNYQVNVAAEGQQSAFNISVPDGAGTMSIETLVSSPLVYPYVAPMTVWNGMRAGNFTFQPTLAPAAPTTQEVSYAGGTIDNGAARYAYFVSSVTQTGETNLSPICFAVSTQNGGTPVPNMALRVFLPASVSGVTAVNIWRTYVDNGHSYDMTKFPANIGLLATVSPSAGYYDDWEGTAAFAARVNTGATPPLYNTTAGQFFASPTGGAVFWITDQGTKVFLPAQFQASITMSGTGNRAPNQTVTDDASVLTKGLADELYAPNISQLDANYRFASGQFQEWDAAQAAVTSTTPWSALGVNNGQTVWSAPIADGGSLDNPLSPPSGANWRFASGQFQMWDVAQAAITPATPWRALGVNNGQTVWSGPLADGGTLDNPAFPPSGANYRFGSGQLQMWDAAQAAINLSQPWRALSVNNGQTVWSTPLAN
jgi:hypothetical protein